MRAILIGLALVALPGCGFLRLGGPPPDWVANRTPLPLCGEEDLGHGEGVDTDARRCLLKAFQSGGEGELISTAISVEGDPVARYTRVHADGTVEVFADATRDSYGSGEWERLTCDGLVPVEETNTEDSYMPPEYVFTEVGCEPAPPA